MKKGINILFPLEDDPLNSFFVKSSITTKEAVKSKILLILNTEIGEWYYRPWIGTKFKKFIFDPNDNQTRNEFEEDIKNVLSKNLPKVKISKINIDDYDDKNKNLLKITIYFSYSDNIFEDEDNVTLYFNINN